MLDGEMLHLVIAVGLVVAVPVVGKIVGTDGCTIEGEVHLVGTEQFLDDLVALLFGDRLQWQPAELVETAAEATQGLIFIAVELQIGGGGGVGGFDFGSFVDEPVVSRGCGPDGHWTLLDIVVDIGICGFRPRFRPIAFVMAMQSPKRVRFPTEELRRSVPARSDHARPSPCGPERTAVASLFATPSRHVACYDVPSVPVQGRMAYLTFLMAMMKKQPMMARAMEVGNAKL